MITGVMVRPGNIQYGITCDALETWHYELEISDKKDVVKATS